MKRINIHFIFLIALIILSIVLLSCKKDNDIMPQVVVKPTTEFLKFDLNSANHLTISQTNKNSYFITTTGSDPYIMTSGILKTIHKDSVVFTFEYKSTKSIDRIQIFFGPYITEERSVFGGSMPSATAWKSYSVNLVKAIKEFLWGKSEDFIRLDFGTNSGIDINIQNIYFRAMDAEEKAAMEKEEQQAKADEEIKEALAAYLSHEFSSKITEVNVDTDKIVISGQCSEEGNFELCEIYPNDTLVTMASFPNKSAIENNPFQITMPRKYSYNGVVRDRLMSKWVIVKKTDSKEEIGSFARYADIIESNQSMPKGIPANKKGLGGFFYNDYSSDLDLLGITSITINIPFTAFMHTRPSANTVAHTYCNKTYYFSQSYLNNIDNALKLTASKNITVAAIILVQKAAECADSEIGRILQHPNYTSEGIYTMPNLTTEEGVNCYAAAIDFLASRYNRTDNKYGRIHKLIIHNEVDAGLTWTNMGNKPMLVYLDTYMKSMRMCHNISRQYDNNSEVMGSFTHSWNSPVESYSSKEMLTALQKFSNVEGDFQWGIAYHPYPQDLNEPKTWNDTQATFSNNSALVTFKNLEVIDHWVKQADNKYMGTVKRTLWLSENGTNSRTYEDQDLKEQAAGFAYAWKKINALDGIDGIQWHNWFDHRQEFGLRIGLRKFTDDESDPAGAKPVWYLYQAAGTNEENTAFEPYKSIIGISDWSEIMHTVH